MPDCQDQRDFRELLAGRGGAGEWASLRHD